jgi:threonine dehydrogenase-like Zn-dependent dehydrogenase
MKRLIQNLKTGRTYLEDVPVPSPGRGQVLIKTACSLVSLGTERMLVEFGKANLLQKARQEPDKVRQVLDKIRSDGLMPTIDAVFKRLDEPLPLGYCNAGVITETGPGLTGFQVGDRVASNGKHAEFVYVPESLCAKIPESVTDEEAAFTVIGAIGLQGIRLCAPTLGETIVVVGLGLIGLITAQFLWRVGTLVIFDSYWLPRGMNRKTGKGDPEKEVQGGEPRCCHAGGDGGGSRRTQSREDAKWFFQKKVLNGVYTPARISIRGQP